MKATQTSNESSHVTCYLGNTVAYLSSKMLSPILLCEDGLAHWTNINQCARPHSLTPKTTPTERTVPAGGLGLKTPFCSSISQPRSSATATESNRQSLQYCLFLYPPLPRK